MLTKFLIRNISRCREKDRQDTRAGIRTCHQLDTLTRKLDLGKQVIVAIKDQHGYDFFEQSGSPEGARPDAEKVLEEVCGERTEFGVLTRDSG